MLIGHAVVRLLEVLEQSTGETTKGNKDKGFFVEDVDLLGNKEGSQTSTESNITSLGDKGVTGQGIDNASGLLLGLNCSKSSMVLMLNSKSALYGVENKQKSTASDG
jgi:hypothetical protein